MQNIVFMVQMPKFVEEKAQLFLILLMLVIFFRNLNKTYLIYLQ